MGWGRIELSHSRPNQAISFWKTTLLRYDWHTINYIFKVYNLIIFDKCTHLWNHHHNDNSEHTHPSFFLCSFVILCSCPSGPLCHPQATTDLRPVTVSLHFLEFCISGIVHHGLFCLTIFTWHDYFEIHPYCVFNSSCSLWLRSITLYAHTVVYSVTSWWMFGIFPVLAYNKAAITFVYKSLYG